MYNILYYVLFMMFLYFWKNNMYFVLFYNTRIVFFWIKLFYFISSFFCLFFLSLPSRKRYKTWNSRCCHSVKVEEIKFGHHVFFWLFSVIWKISREANPCPIALLLIIPYHPHQIIPIFVSDPITTLSLTCSWPVQTIPYLNHLAITIVIG